MNNNLFFLLISCAAICFTIVTICNGPVINGYAGNPDQNCKIMSDAYSNAKKIASLNDEQKKFIQNH